MPVKVKEFKRELFEYKTFDELYHDNGLKILVTIGIDVDGIVYRNHRSCFNKKNDIESFESTLDSLAISLHNSLNNDSNVCKDCKFFKLIDLATKHGICYCNPLTVKRDINDLACSSFLSNLKGIK
jgi:hypothetical protein